MFLLFCSKNSPPKYRQIQKVLLQECAILPKQTQLSLNHSNNHTNELYVYASPEFRCVTKTIFHERTGKTKKGYNQWLHPDIVGVHFPFEDYSDRTLELQRLVGDCPYKIYSFEMKKNLNFTNLREYYFQAVSNSSWANEGYIVALDIDEDESFLAELKRLNNAYLAPSSRSMMAVSRLL